MPRLRCAHCQIWFVCRQHWRIYCSRSCSGLARRGTEQVRAITRQAAVVKWAKVKAQRDLGIVAVTETRPGDLDNRSVGEWR
jgi:hypothetical protein